MYAMWKPTRTAPDQAAWIARGDTDFDYELRARSTSQFIEAGGPIKVLAGLHSGCLELIANESIRSVTDLRGRRVGVEDLTTYRALAAEAHGGLRRARSRQRDIQWVVSERRSRSMNYLPTEDRCIPRHTTPTAGAPRPEDRPHDLQQWRRPPMVAVFVLYAGGQR